jgi:hypothetical protein
MTVAILAIADAVVSALNGATLSQIFTAARAYVPKFDLAGSTGYQVAVVPKADSREPGGQATDSAELLIDIGVMKKLAVHTTAAAELAEIDAALLLCDEIRALVNRHRLAGVEDAICVKIEQNPIYSVEHADEARTFLTVLTTTWITETAV